MNEVSTASKSQELLNRVCTALDVLIHCAQPYHGLFPSIIDRNQNVMMMELPPNIPGQRNGDRAHQGSNLIHDEATLRTLYGLATALERPEYSRAADTYLKRFATHCTDTATGLFPWGEHSFWVLSEDRLGNGDFLPGDHTGLIAVHDHLRQAPVWLWEKLYQFNPRCVARFAEGLDYHWKSPARQEYIRHAYIDQKKRYDGGENSYDFPRHSGFYILDWAFAYARTQRPEFLGQIQTMLDYWWTRRDARGLLLIESRAPVTSSRFHNVNSPGQTLSLGISLLESAELLETTQPALQPALQPPLATTMRERGEVYINAFLSAPHNLEAGVYVHLCRRETGEIIEKMAVWGSVYGSWPLSYVALMALRAWQFTHDERLLRWAQSAGRRYIQQPLPEDIKVPAMDAGLSLGLLADLYADTGDDEWLHSGFTLAARVLEAYFDKPLPRGAIGIDWYESQMGPGFLLHGLARLALLARDRMNCPLDGDYTAR